MRFTRNLYLLLLLGASAVWAQSGVMRHNFEAGAVGLFPVSGYRTLPYSPGTGWRPGYEFRFSRLLGAETGLTQAWISDRECSAHGCVDTTRSVKVLDYGLRAHLLVAQGRLDLSAGIGGGYIWHPPYSYGNGSLLQYSAKAAVALDHEQRFRLAFTFRAWRDPGRPTQQWASASGGVIIGLGGR